MANYLANHLTTYWSRLRQRLPGADAKAEVARIGVLQQTAARRRVDYTQAKEEAELQQHSEPAGKVPALARMAFSRTRMVEAEAAHTLALQTWENKQARQKSR